MNRLMYLEVLKFAKTMRRSACFAAGAFDRKGDYLLFYLFFLFMYKPCSNTQNIQL